MRKHYLLFLSLCAAMTASAQKTTFQGAQWSYAQSATAGDKLSASDFQDGMKVIFARKSNPNKYLSINNSDLLQSVSGAGSGQHNSFQNVNGMSVFTLKAGASQGQWKIESAHEGYYFPVLKRNGWPDYLVTNQGEPVSFEFTAVDEADKSYRIKCTTPTPEAGGGNGWFDGNNTSFTGWQGSGTNSEYYIKSVTPSDATLSVTSPLGTRTSALQYEYTTPFIAGGEHLHNIRLTFKETNTSNKNQGHVYVHIAEFYLYDAQGNKVTLQGKDANTMFSSNATDTGEGSLAGLIDGVVTNGTGNQWYWHSQYHNAVTEDHYIELNTDQLQDVDLSQFKIGYVTRNANCVPTHIDVDVFKTYTMTLTDQTGKTYSPMQVDYEPGETAYELTGVSGATFQGTPQIDEAQGTLTATVVFPFMPSTETLKHKVLLQCAAGNALWYANAAGNIVGKIDSQFDGTNENKDRYAWYLYPTMDNRGKFTFKIQNAGNNKYVPTATAAQATNTANALVEEANAGSFAFARSNGGEGGFRTAASSNIFLTINSATNTSEQNIWFWALGGSHTGSSMSFPSYDILPEFFADKGIAKIDLTAGAEVIAPSGIAAPSEINAAIDAANATTTFMAMKAFVEGEQGQKLATYRSVTEQKGLPVSFDYTIKGGKWGTLCAPVDFAKPAEWTLNKTSGVTDGNVLTLDAQGEQATKATPYLVKSTADTDKTFQIFGYANEKAAETNVTEGLLTGVLAQGSTIPQGSFFLGTKKGETTQKFYRMTDAGANIAVGKCYITLPAQGAGVKELYFDHADVTTAVEDIFAPEAEVIYNVQGQRLQQLQRGLNIVNGKKIMVK